MRQEVTQEVMTQGIQRVEPRRRSLWLALGFALVILVCVAGRNARRSQGRPFAGLLTDPFGAFSAVRWPAWQAESLPLRFPDQLVAIDGQRVRRSGLRAGGALDLSALRRAPAGRAHARQPDLPDRQGRGHDRARHPHAARSTRSSSSSASTRWSRCSSLWSGVAVMVLASRQPAARAYAAWAVGTFVFLVTFFDYHTTAQLVPLFTLSTVVIQVAHHLAGLYLPDAAAPPPASAAGGGAGVLRARVGRWRLPVGRPAPGTRRDGAARDRLEHGASPACWS